LLTGKSSRFWYIRPKAPTLHRQENDLVPNNVYRDE
jgi:hypothetical protein